MGSHIDNLPSYVLDYMGQGRPLCLQAGNTPLGCAVAQKSESAAKALLEYGASPDLLHAGQPPLLMAVEAADEVMVRLLLEYNAQAQTASPVRNVYMYLPSPLLFCSPALC